MASRLRKTSLLLFLAVLLTASFSLASASEAYDIPYDQHSGRLTFARIDFADIDLIESMEELTDYLMHCREMFYKQIPLRLALPLDLDSLTQALNLFDWPHVRYEFIAMPNEYRVLVNATYSAGAHIAYAYQRGSTAGLTPLEMIVYADVVAYLDMVFPWSASPVEQERSIHDYICRRCEYWTTDDDEDSVHADYRSAIGVFFDGRGNCMAYADAFTMLCQMTGLRSFTVHGESGLDADSMIAHAWNVIELDGRWYFVDVTHNDMSYGEFANDYVYFNVGQNMIRYTHQWDDGALFVPVEMNLDENYAYGNTYFPDLIRATDAQSMSDALLLRSRNGYKTIAYAMCDDFRELTDRYVRNLMGRIAADGYVVNVNYSPFQMGNTLYLSLTIDKEDRATPGEMITAEQPGSVQAVEAESMPRRRPRR